MHNFNRSINNNLEVMKSLIIYNFDSHLICLNNWQDKYYFTKAFLILFLFRDNKHLIKYKIVILLKV